MINKSEILFLYESTYSMPNGDPFTGEQRYDDETKKILVSDVRIKRFIRDYFVENGKDVYVINDKSQLGEGVKGSGAALRMLSLKNKYKDDESVLREGKKGKTEFDALKILQKCIDVRLFGGISTEEGDAVNLTGPVQFALLNPSLNSSDLRIHQNTSVFSSSEEKSRGSIGTTTVVPYAVNQIHGWINPFSAKHTSLTDEDINAMFKALWESVNNANTRTKSNQNSLLLIQIVYSEPNKKIYGADRLIKLNSEKRDEQIRNSDDFTLDFADLKALSNNDKVSAVKFYTEKNDWKTQLSSTTKFAEMKF
jgi:CRISPR-associated protein Csh2